MNRKYTKSGWPVITEKDLDDMKEQFDREKERREVRGEHERLLIRMVDEERCKRLGWVSTWPKCKKCKKLYPINENVIDCPKLCPYCEAVEFIYPDRLEKKKDEE